MGPFRYPVIVEYQPMTIAGLAAFVVAEPDFDTRWRLVVEFLKEYHQEPAGERQRLLAETPGPVGDERWDVLFEQASSYVAPGGDPAAARVFDHPGLRVFAASPEHLLAMKAFAARPRDAEDIRQLAKVLDLHTVADVLALMHDIFPEQEPPERLRLLLEDLFPDKG